MAGTTSRSNVWMIDVMQHYLTQNLQATIEETDYLKQLCALKAKQREPIKLRQLAKPSMIIDDFLYHGNLRQALDMSMLNELGIRHIINVCDSPLEKQILDNFNVLWINLSDELDVNIRQHFDKTNDFLHMCQQKDEKVLVHCQMGISRSSSVILAYLLKYHHNTLHEAYDHLVERRRIALPNFGFFLQLIRYEKDLCNSQTTGNKQSSVGLLNKATISPPTVPTVIEKLNNRLFTLDRSFL